MRTHILIAALLLTAGTAHAAPRSLSGAQANPVDAPAQKIQILEAPQPVEQPRVEAPRLDEPKAAGVAAEQAPVAQTAPATAPIEQTPVTTNSAETRPVEAKPAEVTPVPQAKPVKQAHRKQPRRQLTVEQKVHREFRSIERTIHRHAGFALAIPVVIPLYW